MISIAVCGRDSDRLDELCSLLKVIISHRQGTWADINAYTDTQPLIGDIDTKSFDIYVLVIDPADSKSFTELTGSIRERYPFHPVIWISDNDELAMTGFNCHVCGYLLLPVREEELSEVFELALLINRAVPKKPLIIKNSGTVTSIDMNDIIYVENNIRAMKYIMRDGSVVCGVRRNTSFEKALEPLFESGDFIQTHKSFVINMKYINSLKTDSVAMINGVSVPISRKHISNVHDKYARFTSKTG